MEPRVFKKNLIVCAILCSPLFSTAHGAVDVQDKEAVEVITVYGEKVERSLKDTTSSVSVIDKEILDSGQYQSVSNVLAEVPNIIVESGAVPDIRGVTGNGSATGFNSFTGGANARVSRLVDGVAEPFVADLTGDTGLWDIEQIEVYRGPQSTINGRNSIGGTVFIKTADPSFDWEGAARLGYRNQDQFVDSAIMLTGPILEDELAFRITGQNVNGTTFNKGEVYTTNPKTFDQNELITNRWRGKLLWQPAAIEDLSIHYSFSYNNEKGDSGRNYFKAADPWAYEPTFQRYITTKSSTHSMKFDYRLSDSESFDILLAHMDYNWGFESYDPLPVETQLVNMEDKSFTIDGKYSFGLNNREFNGFIGLAYYKRKQDFLSKGGFPYNGDDSSTSSSIYGEATYGIAEKWLMTFGGRIMRDDQTRNFAMQFRGNNIDEVLDKAKTVALPKLVMQYMLDDNTTLAVSGRRGYNAGGGALSLSTQDVQYYYFDEESVNTYEFSSRSQFDNGNVNLNTNLFYNDYDGYQASNSLRKITNIEQAVTYGLEMEFNAMVNENWQIFTGLGLLESEIKKADPAYGDIIGNELNSAPNFTANLGVKYWFSDELTLGLSGNYVGEYFDDIANTQERVAGDYFVSRLNIDYQNEQWRISAFVNNLFDKQALTVNEPVSRRNPDGYAAVIDPRNIGVSVTYSF